MWKNIFVGGTILNRALLQKKYSKRRNLNKIWWAIVGAVTFSVLPAVTVDAAGYKSFKDDNFYRCVVNAYHQRSRGLGNYNTKLNKVSAKTRLSDTQLRQIKNLLCNSAGVKNTAGIEKLTNLEHLEINKNKITNIDVSRNVRLRDLTADNILVKTSATATSVGSYYAIDLSKVLFYRDFTTVGENGIYDYNASTKTLFTRDYAKLARRMNTAKGFAKTNYRYRLSLPKARPVAYGTMAGSAARVYAGVGNVDSPNALVTKLTQLNFTVTQAKGAINKSRVDWYNKAGMKARSLLRSAPYSRTKLISVLVSYGYTRPQATYGVDKIAKPDWNKQAILKAKQLIRKNKYSKKALTEKLLAEKFTKKQIEMAMKAVMR